MLTQTAYANRFIKSELAIRINKVSDKSSHLIISVLVTILVFAFMFIHPSAYNSMVPVVAMIVGHLFGSNNSKNNND